MRGNGIIFMSCPSSPHPSCPSASDLSDFSSFPVINYTSISSHDSTSIITKSDSSSASPLNSSNMAPQDCSATLELASSSMSSLNFPSSTSCQNSSSRPQGSCSPLSLENRSSIPNSTLSTLIQTASETENSPLLLFNGTSTFHTPNHSSSPINCSSTSQSASSSNKSPLQCFCEPQYSSMPCQNSISISQITYSSLVLQNCKSISKHTQSEHSSIPQMNGASTSRTIDYSTSSMDSSSYVITPTEDSSDFLSMSVSDSSILSECDRSSTPILYCKPTNQQAKATQKCHSGSLSDDCSPVDVTCMCICELSTDFSPGISSSDRNSYHSCCSQVKNDNRMSFSVETSLNHSGAPSSPHESPYTLQSPNYLDRSNNITPITGITPLQISNTIHPCGKFTSTNDNNTNIDPLTQWSSENFQSPMFPEIDVVSTNGELPFDPLLVNGHDSPHLPTKSTCSFSLPNYADSLANNKVLNSPSSNTLPAPNSTSPNSTDQTVITSIYENLPKMLSSCTHASFSGATNKYELFPYEEEKQVQECEMCKASLENKVRVDQDRQLCEHFLDSLFRFEDWLQIAQITASQENSYKTLHQEAKQVLRKYEVLLKEMREKLLDLESLNRQYWRLAQARQQTLLPDVLRSRMQEVNTLWDSLHWETETLHRILKSRVQQREEFETDQDDMKLCLTEMDLELSNVEYIYGGNSTEKIQQLKAFQEDVWSNMKKVEGLLERGDQLMDNSDPRDAADLELEMTELESYCQQIHNRLSRLQKRLVSTKLVFEDDFLDGAIEHLSSGSSDVFLDLDIEDEDVSSTVNVPSTNAALPIDLEWDPLGDVGRSSSHDGQESFYTATSTPWKLPRRSEGSRSSLSSYSGIAYSNMKRQEVKESSEDTYPNDMPPQDHCPLERTQEQIHGEGQMEKALALHNSLQQLQTSTGQNTIPSSDEPDSEQQMDNHSGYSWKGADPANPSPSVVIDSQSQPPFSGQRRRPRKKKRMTRNPDTKGPLKPTKPDVSILMENSDDLSHPDLHKTPYRSSCSLCLWIRRLAFISILLLVLVTSLLFPWGHQTCPSKNFSWSLVLTYVNGPPPT